MDRDNDDKTGTEFGTADDSRRILASFDFPMLILITLPIILIGNLVSEIMGYWLGFKETWL